MDGLRVLLAVLVLATAFGLWRRRTDGRIEPVRHGEGSEAVAVDRPASQAADHPAVREIAGLGPEDLGCELGERATLVQFSSAFCTPCRVARVVLGDVAGTVPGVAHVEVDAQSRLDLVRRLDITRTPTVLVLDSAGRIRKRATGAPRRADVIAAIGEIV